MRASINGISVRAGTYLKPLCSQLNIQRVLPRNEALLRAHGPFAGHTRIGHVRAPCLHKEFGRCL